MILSCSESYPQFIESGVIEIARTMTSMSVVLIRAFCCPLSEAYFKWMSILVSVWFSASRAGLVITLSRQCAEESNQGFTLSHHDMNVLTSFLLSSFLDMEFTPHIHGQTAVTFFPTQSPRLRCDFR